MATGDVTFAPAAGVVTEVLGSALEGIVVVVVVAWRRSCWSSWSSCRAARLAPDGWRGCRRAGRPGSSQIGFEKAIIVPLEFADLHPHEAVARRVDRSGRPCRLRRFAVVAVANVVTRCVRSAGVAVDRRPG